MESKDRRKAQPGAPDTWFVYRRTRTEYSAMPANAKGWVALLGCIGATVAISLGAGFWTASISPWLMALALPITIVGGIGFTLWLTKHRGREIP